MLLAREYYAATKEAVGHTNIVKECVAVIDIGSNTVMSLAARPEAGHLVDDLELCETTRLGAGMRSSGCLSAAARKHTLTALCSHRSRLRTRYAHGMGAVVATSAVRDAANGGQFMRSCAEVFDGARPVILSGDDEARFAFRGAAAALPQGTSTITIDVGGGSTEICWGKAREECLFAVSVDVGCVRLNESFGLLERAREEDVGRARAAIRAALHGPIDRLVESARPGPFRVMTSGGTATTFASMQQGLPVYDAGKIHGFAGHAETLRRAARRLLAMALSERACIPGIPPDRAPVLPAGLLILDEALARLQVSSFVVSTHGLRYGLALALAQGEWSPGWVW